MTHATVGHLPEAPTDIDSILPLALSEDLSSKKIQDSWQRCHAAGLDRFQQPRQAETSSQQLHELKDRDSFLLHLVRAEFQKLQKQLPGDSCLLGWANRDAVLIEVACANPGVRSASRAIPGSCWQEQFRGTNAIGTAAFTQGPVAVCMQEHFLREYAALTCIATTLHDPDGELLGMIHLSSNCPVRPRHSMVLLGMAATHIESEMFKRRHRAATVLQFHHREEFAGTLGAGLIAIDEDGHLISSNRQAQSLLEGVPLQPGRHFDEIFRTGFREFMSRPQTGADRTQLTDIKGSSSSVCVYLPESRTKQWPASRNAFKEGEPGKIRTEFVCSDPTVARAVSMASRAVALSAPILIRGETGTGKELLARCIHQMSRRSGPFVAVNCAAVPETLIEAELFGYRDGAFTGARSGGAEGLIVQANQGTLFLDEIGDMPMNLQPALLRFLDNWMVRPIGSNKEVKVDVQLVTATNCDLEQAIVEKRFRRDLLYRINAVELFLPPLHERSDFNEIVTSALAELSPQLRITDEALEILRQHRMPGNVRELRNILLRAALNCDGLECSAAIVQSLLKMPTLTTAEAVERGLPIVQMRRKLILDAYKKSHGNISKVAQDLHLSRNTVYRELRQSGVIGSGMHPRTLHRATQ